MPKKILFFSILAFFLLVLPFVYSSVVINEIMPLGNEWVEIYNPHNLTLNLSNWNIKDNSSNYPEDITCYNITNCSLITNATYFLIIGRNINNITEITNQTITYFYVDDEKIGDGLNDKGDNITFYNSTYSTNFVYNSSKENKSWARIPDGNWIECETPTPGSANICAEKEKKEDIKLKVELDDKILLDVLYNNLFEIEIEKKTNCLQLDNVTVYYNITDEFSNLVKEDNFTKEIGCNKSRTDTGNWQPNQTGNFTLCGFANSTTVEDKNFSNNYACKNITVKEKPLTILILSKPTSSIWGSFNSLSVKFDTTYYPYNKTRFLIYGGIGTSGARVVTDSNWNKITSFAQCQGGTEIDITANQTYFLNISFFLYKNCNNDYVDGSYNITLRVCSLDSDWEKYNESTFDMIISGKNSTLCSSPPDEEEGETETKGKLSYAILYVPKEIILEKNFSIKIEINNTFNSTQKLSLWSYVYKDNKCYSCKKNETREGNMENLTISSFSSVVVELWDVVEEAEEGEYKIKIKILRSNYVTPTEYTYNVTIKREKKEEKEGMEEARKEEKEETGEGSKTKITGKIIYESVSEKLAKYALFVMAAAFLFLIFYFYKKRKHEMIK